MHAGARKQPVGLKYPSPTIEQDNLTGQCFAAPVLLATIYVMQPWKRRTGNTSWFNGPTFVTSVLDCVIYGMQAGGTKQPVDPNISVQLLGTITYSVVVVPVVVIYGIQARLSQENNPLVST
jgi:hypothetical protein